MTAVRPAFFDDLILSRAAKLALLIWGVVSLLAMLAYPFAYDQAAFFTGGEMIVRRSAIPYRDLIDTKPPLIFYLYGGAAALFGHNQWGIRLVDVFWQATTAFVLFRLLSKQLSSEGIAFLATFLYVWQYAASGYWMTAQAESFAILPTLLIAGLVLSIDDRKAFRSGLVSGVLLAIIFLLKFTLVLFFLGVIVYLVRRRFRSETIPYLLGSILSFALVFGGYLYHLHLVGGLENFVEAVRWVREYAALTPIFGAETIGMEYHKLFPEFMLRAFSISLTVLGGWGLVRVFSTAEAHSKHVYSLFSMCLLFAMLGVLYERKFFPYHYTRAFVFLTPFIAVGIAGLWHWLSKKRLSLGILVLGAVLLFFSPLMQTFTQTISWPIATVLGKDREAIVQAKVKNYYAKEQRLVGEYLRERLLENEQIFFWGNGVGVYHFTDRLPQSFALTVTPFITPWTSISWKQELIRQLNETMPRYFIVEQDDAREYISGSEVDSYTHLQRWAELRDFVTSHYSEEARIGHFILYRRH